MSFRLTSCLLLLTLSLAGSGLLSAGAGAQETPEDRELTILTFVEHPFTIESQGRYTGFGIDLWREVAEMLSLRYRIVEEKDWSAMLDKVAKGKADAVVANLSITSVREEVMDFSQPIFDSGLQIMTRKTGAKNSILSVLLSWEILSLLGSATIVLLAVANLMWLLERKVQTYFQHPYPEGLWRSFWWALNVIVNGGFEEQMPRTKLGRLFATVLVISSLFIVSLFVAQLTAVMTVNELRTGINSVDDLYGHLVGVPSGSTAADFLERKSVRFQEYDDLAGMLAALESGEVDAVVHDAPILAYYATTGGRGRVETVGAVFHREKYGFALPQNSPLIEPINRSLLRLRETGVYPALVEKWFGEDY